MAADFELIVPEEMREGITTGTTGLAGYHSMGRGRIQLRAMTPPFTSANAYGDGMAIRYYEIDRRYCSKFLTKAAPIVDYIADNKRGKVLKTPNDPIDPNAFVEACDRSSGSRFFFTKY